MLLRRKLTWDPLRGEFPGDEEANRLRSRAMREPWHLQGRVWKARNGVCLVPAISRQVSAFSFTNVDVTPAWEHDEGGPSTECSDSIRWGFDGTGSRQASG